MKVRDRLDVRVVSMNNHVKVVNTQKQSTPWSTLNFRMADFKSDYSINTLTEVYRTGENNG